MARESLLIGDLGGTHARFARAATGGVSYTDEMTLPCSAYESAGSAIDDYLVRTGGWQPQALCLAVAAPVERGTARFLNSDWQLDAASLEVRFPGADIRLVNDFQAMAHAIPFLRTRDVRAIGPMHSNLPGKDDFTIGVIGPGTGLGVGGLLRIGGRDHALSSEGGHLGFAPENTLQMKVLEQLRGQFGRVSNERLLSGPGIESIYRAVQAIRKQSAAAGRADEIMARARSGEDDAAIETEKLFFEILGQVAGNLALTLGARDGIFLAGGILPLHQDRLEMGPFRAGFENKGRHRSLMERIPTWLITHPDPGLLGAACLVRSGEEG